MSLRFDHAELIPLGKDTFMWIQITVFAIEDNLTNEALLEGLVASDEYAHDYASPFDPAAAHEEPPIHGRWWRSAIHVDMFRPTTQADAERVLQRWADEQDWTDPDFHQPADAQARLQAVFELLRSGHLYRLDNPPESDEHDWGWSTGGNGFHEFVVIDRAAQLLSLVVATDD